MLTHLLVDDEHVPAPHELASWEPQSPQLPQLIRILHRFAGPFVKWHHGTGCAQLFRQYFGQLAELLRLGSRQVVLLSDVLFQIEQLQFSAGMVIDQFPVSLATGL